MAGQSFFIEQPFPGTVRRLFLESGATFDFSLEDRRKCGSALERHFADHPGTRATNPWFMPIIFGGVAFRQAPPWAVMLAMGIYGYLAEGSPAPVTFRPGGLALGYHALRIPPSAPFSFTRNGTRLPLTDAFLRIDDKADARIWTDLYGLAPLAPGVRMAPFTLIPAGDLRECIAGAILVDVDRAGFLNPLKRTFLPSEAGRFFTEEPSPARLGIHRERLSDILGIPLDVGEADLDVGLDLIRQAYALPAAGPRD
ncbi:hypothetical protein [Geothrix sp. 21YS21S-2]|uniref:hypothetical protein n=1 Tax=Geothrix sp. 21YS21S-2 TaxID=3068893 RepID=UPI0027BA8458|nr:hypothetical protein [Geothrix sp. 21YS21S-2]